MSDASPELDIRWPIGLLFAAIGALLAVYGALGGSPEGALLLGRNLNFWWGIVMLLFGLGMIAGAYRAQQSGR